VLFARKNTKVHCASTKLKMDKFVGYALVAGTASTACFSFDLTRI